ncbi:MAG: hypothetical protein WA210_07980 [Burkholderiaceae bacterium]
MVEKLKICQVPCHPEFIPSLRRKAIKDISIAHTKLFLDVRPITRNINRLPDDSRTFEIMPSAETSIPSRWQGSDKEVDVIRRAAHKSF